MPNRNAICLCTDQNMLIPALFVAHSANKAAGPARSFDTIVFTNPSDASGIHHQWMSDHDIWHRDDLDTAQINEMGILQERLSSATLMKLLLASHLAGRYDKILYLDADLMIHGDVSAIFELDTGKFPLAAVPAGRIWVHRKVEDRRKAEEHFRALGMTAPYRYFNTGVFLIDVEKWNREDLGARALTFIRQHSEICFLPDEDGLNGVLDGHITELSPIWNMRPLRSGYRPNRAFRPVIVHHAGEDKPWRRYGYGKRLFPDRTAYRLYESFLADTPWAGWLDEQWNKRDLYKSCVWEVRRITRRVRGRLDEPSRRQHRAYIEAIKSYCAQTNFADVVQGITIQQDGTIRLKTAQAAPA